MAVLELCDLCGGKVKRRFVTVTIAGKVQLYAGDPPPPPKGFKYREDEHVGTKMIKTWDAFGKYQGMVEFVEKPPKAKNIHVVYEMCEVCSQKLLAMLESLRRQYHLEQKDIAMLSDKSGSSFWDNLTLGFEPSEEE